MRKHTCQDCQDTGVSHSTPHIFGVTTAFTLRNCEEGRKVAKEINEQMKEASNDRT